MLKKYLSYMLAAAVALLAAGCADDLAVSPEGEMLHLQITDVSPGVATRAVPAELEKPLAERFRLAIVNESGRTVYDDAFAPVVGPFAPGRFALAVNYGEDVLALDAPCYAGTATASIYKGLYNNISISARVANALMSVAYQADGRELLDEAFESYAVTLTLDGREVSLDGPAPAASAYFPAGSVPEVVFRGVRADDGREVTTPLSALLASKLPLEAGRHLKVTLGVSEDRVQITKADIEEVTISETVPPEWLPRPKAAMSGFQADGTLRNVETNATGEVKLDFTTSSALQDVELTLGIQDPGYAHLSGTYLLSQMSDAQVETLRTAGIELPALGTEAGTVTLTRFATNLQTDKGAETTNTLALRVKANDRWDTDTPANYQIIVEKPEFTISVDERNVWSKTLTADEANVSRGNPERILSKLRYQYSADGGATWQEFTDGKTLKFASHPTVKQYKLRAMYREGILSNAIDCTLESPVQLPNSGMEEWHYTNVARKMNCYYPWNDGGTAFWNTNNLYTTRYKSTFSSLYAGSNPYNCMPAVSYVVPGHTGNRAAEIRSTASGRGNTLFGNVLNLNKVPGELFTADISVTKGGTDAIPKDDNYTVDAKGRSFASRPTALHFWYKYAPLNNDAWRAKIMLLDANNNSIIEKNLETSGAQGNWVEQTVSLDYLPDGLYAKCSRILVIFSSSIHDTRNDEMPWQAYDKGYSLWEGDNLVLKNDTKCWLGSILTIDDISLVYDK